MSYVTVSTAPEIFLRVGGVRRHFFSLYSTMESTLRTGNAYRMSNGPMLAGWQQRSNRSLLRFLGRRVRSAVDIEDLAQETYLRLLRARDLGEVRNPQAYLLRVASHVLVEWRDSEPRPELLVMINDDLLSDDCSPQFELEAGISQERLNHTLATVSPTMRAVLLLRLRDERSCKDIAEELDITLRQVRRCLARGYERLRTALEN
jgi:RNA polymerase sigma factor (sigma-70 family)